MQCVRRRGHGIVDRGEVILSIVFFLVFFITARAQPRGRGCRRVQHAQRRPLQEQRRPAERLEGQLVHRVLRVGVVHKRNEHDTEAAGGHDALHGAAAGEHLLELREGGGVDLAADEVLDEQRRLAALRVLARVAQYVHIDAVVVQRLLQFLRENGLRDGRARGHVRHAGVKHLTLVDGKLVGDGARHSVCCHVQGVPRPLHACLLFTLFLRGRLALLRELQRRRWWRVVRREASEHASLEDAAVQCLERLLGVHRALESHQRDSLRLSRVNGRRKEHVFDVADLAAAHTSDLFLSGGIGDVAEQHAACHADLV
eukprot:PhM_4_TR10087/c3_g1_i1/m.75621